MFIHYAWLARMAPSTRQASHPLTSNAAVQIMQKRFRYAVEFDLSDEMRAKHARCTPPPPPPILSWGPMAGQQTTSEVENQRYNEKTLSSSKKLFLRLSIQHQRQQRVLMEDASTVDLPSIPDSHKRNIFTRRTGQVWNQNLALKRLM